MYAHVEFEGTSGTMEINRTNGQKESKAKRYPKGLVSPLRLI